MKKTYVVSIQPDVDGPIFGRVMDPLDFQKSQDMAHDHINRVVKNLLMSGAAAAQVDGFDATRTAALGVSIAPGDVVDPNGVSYELDAAAVVNMNAADQAHARIDLIYATLAIDVPSNSEFKPFRQLHTLGELEAGASPYSGVSQFNEPTELHTSATIAVRAGVPGVNPAAPAAGAGEVSLWQVHVAANQAVLADNDLIDVRSFLTSLYTITQYKGMLDAATSAATPNTLMKRDVNGDVQTRDFKPTRQILFSDSSIQLSAFVRESFISMLDENTPVGFHSGVDNVYSTVKRVAAASVPDSGTGDPSVSVAPEFDCYVDPADFVNVLFRLEAYALHTATQPPGDAANTSNSYLQLWNATDGAELAALSFTWLNVAGSQRSSTFSITGAGYKRLVLRAKHTTSANALFDLWRVRLIINPSF